MGPTAISVLLFSMIQTQVVWYATAVGDIVNQFFVGRVTERRILGLTGLLPQ